MRFTATSAVVLAAVAVGAAFVVAPTGRAGVQQVFDFYVHGLSLDGRVGVNGTTIEKYRSPAPGVAVADDAVTVLAPEGDFVDPWVDVISVRPQHLWSALVTDGADRYALRRDGRVKKNDSDLFDLEAALSPWLDMLAADGHTYALRADGALALDGEVIARHAPALFHFRRVVRHVPDLPDLLGQVDETERTDVYCLRSDGSVFRNDEFPVRFAFRAGGDGVLTTTTWIAAAVGPDADADPDPEVARASLYALRSDGVVKRGELVDRESFGETYEDRFGEFVARLPFDATVEPILGQLYVDLAVTDDGSWYALTGDGRVYSNADATVPFAELPLRAVAAGGSVYTDLALLGNTVCALRSDGGVYEVGTLRPLCRLPRSRYGSLALSSFAPVLTRRNKQRPAATIVRTRIVEGTPLTLPVVATDLDTDAADLVVTPGALPAGATWDANAAALVWNTPGPPGRYAFRFRISDGRHTRRFAYRIDVRAPDTDPAVNARPLTPAFERALACTGAEFVLPVIVDDPDGDPVTVKVNTRAYPFTAGATFDAVTNTFRWTPAAEDCGIVTVRFRVSDGRRPRVVRLRLRVKNGLFY